MESGDGARDLMVAGAVARDSRGDTFENAQGEDLFDDARWRFGGFDAEI